MQLTDFISVALLQSPRLVLLGGFNIHTEALSTGLALDFMESKTSMRLSQQVSGPAHVGAHALNLVFLVGQGQYDLRVNRSSPCTLSWPNHHLLKFGLAVPRSHCGKKGEVRMVRPW